MDEVWTVRAGEMPYEEAREAQKRLEAARQRRDARHPAAARAPARLHKGRRSTPTSCRWARTGTGAGDRGARDRPRRPGHLPRPGPAGRLPDRRSCGRTETTFTSTSAGRAGHDRLPRRSRDRGEMIEGLTGVWPAGAAGRSARSASTSTGRHHARLCDQRQQRPAALRVDRALRHRGCRMTSVPASTAPSRTWGLRATRASATRDIYEREPVLSVAELVARADLPLPRRRGRGTVERWPSDSTSRGRGRTPADGRRIAEGAPFRERKPPWLRSRRRVGRPTGA